MATKKKRAPPRRLLSKKSGELKPPPKRLAKLFSCPGCGKLLIRSTTMWVCPSAMGCCKARPDAWLIEEIEKLLVAAGLKRWTGQGIVALQRRVSQWAGRLTNKAKMAAALKERVDELIRAVAEKAKMPEGTVQDAEELTED